jgi:hypothetical protein
MQRIELDRNASRICAQLFWHGFTEPSFPLSVLCARTVKA